MAVVATGISNNLIRVCLLCVCVQFRFDSCFSFAFFAACCVCCYMYLRYVLRLFPCILLVVLLAFLFGLSCGIVAVKRLVTVIKSVVVEEVKSVQGRYSVQ